MSPFKRQNFNGSGINSDRPHMNCTFTLYHLKKKTVIQIIHGMRMILERAVV